MREELYLQTRNNCLVIPYTKEEFIYQNKFCTANDIVAVWKIKDKPSPFIPENTTTRRFSG